MNELKNNSKTITAIYVYYNTPKEILNSVKSLQQTAGKLIKEIIIVDNFSPTPLPKWIEQNKKIRIIKNKENKGYGAGLNQGARIAKGKYLLLLNPDTIFLKDSIGFMLEKMKSDTSIGVLGPQLLDEKRKIQIVGNGSPFLPNALFAFTFLNKIFPNNPWSQKYYLTGFDRRQEAEIPVICGACMMVKKSVFEKIGGFDERFFMYFEESDFCIRIKSAGYKVVYFAKAKVIHLIGKSTKDKEFIRKNFERSRLEFFKKYHNLFVGYLGEYIIRILNKI